MRAYVRMRIVSPTVLIATKNIGLTPEQVTGFARSLHPAPRLATFFNGKHLTVKHFLIAVCSRNKKKCSYLCRRQLS